MTLLRGERRHAPLGSGGLSVQPGVEAAPGERHAGEYSEAGKGVEKQIRKDGAKRRAVHERRAVHRRVGLQYARGRLEDAFSWQHNNFSAVKNAEDRTLGRHFRVLPRVSSKCDWKVVALCKSSGLCPHLRSAFAMGGGSDLQRLSGGENCVLGMVTGIMAKACNYPFLVWKNTVQQGLKISLDPVCHRWARTPD